MPAPRELVELYVHLASASEEQRRPLQRDKFLVLAASIAQGAGSIDVAEEFRYRILQNNPNHMLKAYGSMAEAMGSDDVRHYTHQLLRLYPFEKAEYLLHKFLAGGYSGRHGYGEWLKRIPDKPGQAGAGARALSAPPPTEVVRHSPSSAVNRIAELTTRSSGGAVGDPSRAKPAEAATPNPVAKVRSEIRQSEARVRLLSWVVLAFAVGLIVGGAFVHFAIPGP
jgi:hypothetical protein